MPRLDYDCYELLFQIFSEEPEGCNLLYNCTLLNRNLRNLATPYLYRDPWKYWLYQSKDDVIARQLIDTYILCYNAVDEINSERDNNSNGRDEEGDEEGDEEKESPTKRRYINSGGYVNNGNCQHPLYDYVTFAKNLHIPSLYQCVKFWYQHNNGEVDDNQIYDIFLKIYKLFVDRARIKDCTFAESTEDDHYPIKSEQLEQLINHSPKVNLKYLNLGFFQCDSDGLKKITGRCTKLRTFKVSAQKCSDEALANFIRSQKRLTKLKIRNAENINLTLEALGSQSQSLVKLRILSCSLESCRTPFYEIAACSNLRSIYLRKITDWPVDVSPLTLLMPIAKNCEFHNIDFDNTELPVEILIEIAKKSSTTLRRVHLVRPENQIDHERYNLSAGIKALGNHAKNIIHFERDILRREVSAVLYFLSVAGSSLTRLEIESRSMGDHDSSELIISISNNCPKLEVLNINYYIFALEAFKKLVQGCNSLTNLSICNTMVVNDTMLSIIQDKCENLIALDIYSCSQVSEDAVEQLRSDTEIDVGWP